MLLQMCTDRYCSSETYLYAMTEKTVMTTLQTDKISTAEKKLEIHSCLGKSNYKIGTGIFIMSYLAAFARSLGTPV